MIGWLLGFPEDMWPQLRDWSERTIIVEIGSLRPFSDIAGRHVIRLDDTSQRRQELALRLRDAGCSVSLDGTDWHAAGAFDASVATPA